MQDDRDMYVDTMLVCLIPKLYPKAQSQKTVQPLVHGFMTCTSEWKVGGHARYVGCKI